MVKILDSLADDHAHMARVLSLLEFEIAREKKSGGPDYALMARILDYFLSFPDLCHHPKEDLIYRRLEERDKVAARKVGDLIAEHDKLASMVHKLAFTATRKALGDEDDAATPAWFMSMARNLVDAHRHHMRLEDDIFFPVAREVLSDDDWNAIDDLMAKYNENFLCPETRARLDRQFRELFDKLPKKESG